MTGANTSPPGGHAAVYDALMWPFERAALGAWRRRLAADARGRVLEVGAGTGSQLRWYPAGAQVMALEPDPGMSTRARRAALRAAARVTVVEGVAEHLPFADASFETAVTSFSFCTVADPAAALGELRRVLIAGGRLLMLEHVHLPWQPGRGLQSLAAPAWAAVAGGCRLDRDTGRFVRDAGFSVLRERSHVLGWIVELEARSPVGLHGPPISG
jgi:ubiquinone/menaquinone biosynthesis C-methylase UbiE